MFNLNTDIYQPLARARHPTVNGDCGINYGKNPENLFALVFETRHSSRMEIENFFGS